MLKWDLSQWHKYCLYDGIEKKNVNIRTLNSYPFFLSLLHVGKIVKSERNYNWKFVGTIFN